MARKTLIQVRRDTSSNWASVNPVLAEGEMGFETNTLKFKIGNGTTAWNSLDYSGTNVLTAKGDLITRNATTVIKLPVGATNGHLLMVDSTADAGMKWAEGSFAPKTPSVGSSLGTSGTVTLDMSALNGTYQTISLTGGITFNTSNRSGGRTVTIKLIAGGSSRSLSFPSWIFVGAAAPTTLAANKTSVITVTFFDSTDAAAVAAYAAQP